MDTKNFDLLFSSNEIKLKNQKRGKTLCINLFRAVKTRFVETYLCYNVKHNRIFYANCQLKDILVNLKQIYKLNKVIILKMLNLVLSLNLK